MSGKFVGRIQWIGACQALILIGNPIAIAVVAWQQAGDIVNMLPLIFEPIAIQIDAKSRRLHQNEPYPEDYLPNSHTTNVTNHLL